MVKPPKGSFNFVMILIFCYRSNTLEKCVVFINDEASVLSFAKTPELLSQHVTLTSRVTHICFIKPGRYRTVGQRKKVIAVIFFPVRPEPDQMAQITTKYATFPWRKSRDRLVYRMDGTWSQLIANTGILVCQVREIAQFQIFMGNEVIALHEERNW